MIFTLNLRTLRPLRLCGRYSEFRLRLSRTGSFVVNSGSLLWLYDCLLARAPRDPYTPTALFDPAIHVEQTVEPVHEFRRRGRLSDQARDLTEQTA